MAFYYGNNRDSDDEVHYEERNIYESDTRRESMTQMTQFSTNEEVYHLPDRRERQRRQQFIAVDSCMSSLSQDEERSPNPDPFAALEALLDNDGAQQAPALARGSTQEAAADDSEDLHVSDERAEEHQHQSQSPEKENVHKESHSETKTSIDDLPRIPVEEEERRVDADEGVANSGVDSRSSHLLASAASQHKDRTTAAAIRPSMNTAMPAPRPVTSRKRAGFQASLLEEEVPNSLLLQTRRFAKRQKKAPVTSPKPVHIPGKRTVVKSTHSIVGTRYGIAAFGPV